MSKVITGIDHPAIVFKDIVAMCKWYEEVLDYEQVAENKDNGARLLKAADGSYIEAMVTDGSERPAKGYFQEGYSHLALRVVNLDEAIAELEHRGVKWTGEIVPAVGTGRLRNFQDPEGNDLQIIER